LRALAELALRRIRLLTALALIVGLWLIVGYAPSWHTTKIATAVIAAVALLALAARALSLRRARGRT
jgi:hypothetical protein